VRDLRPLQAAVLVGVVAVHGRKVPLALFVVGLGTIGQGRHEGSI
jgi:hypothetical protein